MTEESSGIPGWLRGVIVLVLLYLFLAGVGLLSEGIEGLGSDIQATLFERVQNPLAGLFVGILATVLVQSSSVTTSTIVGMVAAGLIGVGDAVPMVMGANIGTSVTNTLASVGSIRRPVEFRRAVAAATVHDFFNVLAVIVLLPLELLTGVLSRGAELLSSALVGSGGTKFKSPIKEAVKAPVEVVFDLLKSAGADGTWLGVLAIVVGLLAIFGALAYITVNMKALVAERFEARINQVLGSGSGITAMLVGVLATVAVQSSSITTSLMVPLCAAGVMTLELVFPLMLGANIGTTVTALIASLSQEGSAALAIALVHLLFNLIGVAIVYPFPAVRRIPIGLARGLAFLAIQNRLWVVVYVLGTFVVLPLGGWLLWRHA